MRGNKSKRETRMGNKDIASEKGRIHVKGEIRKANKIKREYGN